MDQINGGKELLSEFDFLYGKGIRRGIFPDGKTPTLAYLINTVMFKTRTDKDMCSSYFYVPDHGWLKTTVFGSGVVSHRSELKKDFEWKMVKLNRGKNDQLTLNGVVSAEKWCSMNLIDVDAERSAYAGN
jgi:hypothetical protein